MDSGFKLDYTSVISDLLFSGKEFVDDFLVTMGFFDSASWLGSIFGNRGSLLEAAVWSETTEAGQTVAVKMNS